MLFGAERHAGDVGVRHRGQIKGEAAPSRADVEHLYPRAIEPQFRRDVPLLVLLSPFKTVVGRSEIGAGILPVAIEKNVVKLGGEIVMVCHIVLRLGDRIVLLQAAADALDGGEPRQASDIVEIARDHVEEIVERAVFDPQRPSM